MYLFTAEYPLDYTRNSHELNGFYRPNSREAKGGGLGVTQARLTTMQPRRSIHRGCNNPTSPSSRTMAQYASGQLVLIGSSHSHTINMEYCRRIISSNLDQAVYTDDIKGLIAVPRSVTNSPTN